MQAKLADEYWALTLDAATGAASPADTLLMETHAALKPEGRAGRSLAEALGGAFLETAPLQGSGELRRVAGDARTMQQARAAVRLAAIEPDALAWRELFTGVKALKLSLPGARLVRLAEGRRLPEHGHLGEERTLVLRGAYDDAQGLYQPGDISFADEAIEHAPRAVEDCVCLIASSGAMKFKNIGARIAHRFLWR